ncbi:MAG TPA: hypothetical protein VMV57_12000 [Terracidiphilus sp.]|nr:hypothetical protein [Terracidiphilus sp.]
MEADWEVEVGGEARVIEPEWPGFVDLRANPERAELLEEMRQLPALGHVLVQLNARHSPVWTSKCDVWECAEFDPDELDIPREQALKGAACYVDLLAGEELNWESYTATAEWCRAICDKLRAVLVRSCRVDLVVRAAHLAAGRSGFAVTAYLTAAGPVATQAAGALARGLAALADAVVPFPASAGAA